MTTANATMHAPVARGPASGSLWRAGVVAAVAAAGVNAVLFLLAVAAGIFPSAGFVPGEPGMALGPVVLVSALGALAGVGVFALLRRWAKQPLRLFLGLAGGVLLLSFAAPFVIPGLTTAQIAVLEVLHLVVAAITMGAIVRWTTLVGRR